MPATPAYRLPGEWEPQWAAMLTWPHAGGEWGSELPLVEETFLRLARTIASRQTLLVACHGGELAGRVRHLLRDCGDQVTVFPTASNDIWVRDHGPITIIGEDGRPRLLDFRFNGWGGKYPADLDDALTAALARQGAFGNRSVLHLPWILEGGSLDSDGEGTLLTTGRCLLDPRRNPDTDRDWWEEGFRRWFGVSRVLWLAHGELQGDDTDGHVDMLARFITADTIVHVACDDPADPHYHPLHTMKQELDTFRRADGSPYRLIPLPWPSPRHDAQGRRLPLSYANFLLINGAVLVPAYDVPEDVEALELMRSLFPNRDVVPIPAMPLIRQGGAVHCATQHIPLGGHRAAYVSRRT